jgi:hypothetical protein
VASRSHLKSVAEGVARKFVSRNNDVDGWWAMGLLAGVIPQGDAFELDLLAGKSKPSFDGLDSGLRWLSSMWMTYFQRSNAQHGLANQQFA